MIKHSLMFEFKANNIQAEYEAIIVSMVIALETGTSSMKSESNSQLVENQVVREYQIKDP